MPKWTNHKPKSANWFLRQELAGSFGSSSPEGDGSHLLQQTYTKPKDPKESADLKQTLKNLGTVLLVKCHCSARSSFWIRFALLVAPHSPEAPWCCRH